MDSVQCTLIPFELKKFDLTCPYGSMAHLKPHHFGINSYKDKTRDACVVNATKYNNSDCTELVLKERFMDFYQDNCFGKANCTIHVYDFID